jgi:hypothetical protein
MRRAVAVFPAVLALAAVPAASSATPRIQVHVRAQPTLVEVGAAVRTRLLVYEVTKTGPVLTDARRFQLVAVSPLGDRTPLGLRHVARGTWSGSVRLRVAGRWLIRVARWPGAGTVPSVAVHVRESPPPPPPPPGPR